MKRRGNRNREEEQPAAGISGWLNATSVAMPVEAGVGAGAERAWNGLGLGTDARAFRDLTGVRFGNPRCRLRSRRGAFVRLVDLVAAAAFRRVFFRLRCRLRDRCSTLAMLARTRASPVGTDA